MGVEETIMQKLEDYGIADHGYKPGLMKHLIKIETALSELDEQFTKADQELKESRPNVKKVSKMSGVSRQTFYNNPLLGEYVECAAAEQAQKDPYSAIDRLKVELEEHKSKVQKMIDRDADIALYIAKNAELEDEVRSLQATIKSQQETIRSLKQQNRSNRKENNARQARVISISAE